MDIIWSGTLREKLDLKHPFLSFCPTFYTHKHTPIHTPFSSTRHNPPFLWHSSLFLMLNPQLLNWHFCGLSRFSVTSHILLLQCLLCTQVFPPVPHLIHLLLHKNTQTSCLLAPPHSQGTQPKKPSRHPVTSQSQPCDKTCGFLMITTWWYSKSHTLDSYSNSIVNMKSQTAHTKNILMHFRSWASIWRIRTKQLPHGISEELVT